MPVSRPKIFKEATEFSQFIEQQAHDRNQSYLETILHYIEERDLDYERVNNLIAPSLRSKLLKDFQDIGMIKSESDISEFFA